MFSKLKVHWIEILALLLPGDLTKEFEYFSFHTEFAHQLADNGWQTCNMKIL